MAGGSSPEVRHCFNCGASVLPGAAFCAACGTDVSTPFSRQTATSYDFAGFWQRFLALLLDGFIALALSLIPGAILATIVGIFVYDSQEPFFTQQQEDDAFALAAEAGLYVWLVVALAVSAIYWSLGNATGGTWGKRAVGLRVVKDSDGSEPKLGSGFVRWFVGWSASTWFFYLGYLWMLWDTKKQTWHDKVAGTLVVRQ